MLAPEQIAYVNARIVDPKSNTDTMGALITGGDEIQAVGPNLFPEGVPQNFTVVDCGGHMLCPGLIDMRVSTGEPGAENKETLASVGDAAAAGGVTTILLMPDTDPVIDDISLVDFILRRSRDRARVNIYPMAALTKGLMGEQLTEFGLLLEAGAVAFTDGKKSVQSAALIRQALSYAKTFNALICHHTEDYTLTHGKLMNESEYADRLGLGGIPNIAESIIIERDLAINRLVGGRYHAAQISCRESLEAVRKAKEEGQNVTCAVSSHHIALNELDIGEYRTFLKTNPPLRSEEDRQAMVAGLADGTIDVLVSSHDPQAPENKRLPFAEAADGCVGVETLLPIALERYHNGEVDLISIIRRLTNSPAELLGLKKGRLEAGTKADFIIVNINQSYVLDASKLRSRSKNSPYDGRRVQGRVIRTVVNGKTVFEHTDASEEKHG